MNTNPKVTSIAINAKGGALTPITMTIVASRVEVMEDPASNGGVQQGLTGFYTDTQPATGNPNVGPQMVWLPNNQGQVGRAYEPIIFGGQDGRVKGGEGRDVGSDGTIVLRLTSNGGAPCNVLLAEWA
jgi:hypothetical protein